MGSGASSNSQPRVTMMKVMPSNSEDRMDAQHSSSVKSLLPFRRKKEAPSRVSAFVAPKFGKTNEAKFSRKSHGGSLKLECKAGGLNGKVEKGKYKLGDLCSFPDLQIRPPYAEIHPVRWVKGKPHGEIQLPVNWDCDLPVVYATQPYLNYYNCSFGNMNDDVLRVKWAHEFLDFTYGDDYKDKWVMDPSLGAGGLGIEMHKFIHMECPLSDDSGHFIMGRLEDDPYSDDQVLMLTAFKFPTFHTVFIAPDAIHSNDHLKGLWRTMLSAFTPEDMKLGRNEIDHCLLMKPDESGDFQKADLTFTTARTSQKAVMTKSWQDDAPPTLLQHRFREGVEDKVPTGAGNARKSAVGKIPTHVQAGR